jgi:hypothetical protein
MIWLLPRPLPLYHQKARPATHRKTEKERKLAHGRRGGGGQGAKKAWSSINHSILSAPTYMCDYNIYNSFGIVLSI